MEAVRQIIDSQLLDGIISLPKIFHDKKVEIFVFLAESKKEIPHFTVEALDSMLEGSETQSLIGVLSSAETPDATLEDYRAERLKKYEYID